MSYWTHIIGVLHINTYKEVDDVQRFVEDSLKGAPLITGSEGPAAVFVNSEPGYCVSTSCDCRRCQYRDTLRNYSDGFECDAPDGFVCPQGQYQTRCVITVCGDLRDRRRDRTRKEWNKFHRYIAKELGYGIRMATCKIDGR